MNMKNYLLIPWLQWIEFNFWICLFVFYAAAVANDASTKRHKALMLAFKPIYKLACKHRVKAEKNASNRIRITLTHSKKQMKCRAAVAIHDFEEIKPTVAIKANKQIFNECSCAGSSLSYYVQAHLPSHFFLFQVNCICIRHTLKKTPIEVSFELEQSLSKY